MIGQYDALKMIPSSNNVVALSVSLVFPRVLAQAFACAQSFHQIIHLVDPMPPTYPTPCIGPGAPFDIEAPSGKRIKNDSSPDGKELYITTRFLGMFGGTPGCNGCKRLVDILEKKPLLPLTITMSTGRPHKRRHTLACKSRFVRLLNDYHHFGCNGQGSMRLNVSHDATMDAPFVSDIVHEDGCDDRPCPQAFGVDAFHQGKTETPGSLVGSSTNAGSSSQASDGSANESDSQGSAAENADATRVLMVDASHSQPKEPDVIILQRNAGAQENYVPTNTTHKIRQPKLVSRRVITETLKRAQKGNYKARQLYLKPKDFDDFGLTRGCARCDHFHRFGCAGPKHAHTQACRDRIATELAKTVDGQARIAATNHRMDIAVRESNKDIGCCC